MGVVRNIDFEFTGIARHHRPKMSVPFAKLSRISARSGSRRQARNNRPQYLSSAGGIAVVDLKFRDGFQQPAVRCRRRTFSIMGLNPAPRFLSLEDAQCNIETGPDESLCFARTGDRSF